MTPKSRVWVRLHTTFVRGDIHHSGVLGARGRRGRLDRLTRSLRVAGLRRSRVTPLMQCLCPVAATRLLGLGLAAQTAHLDRLGNVDHLIQIVASTPSTGDNQRNHPAHWTVRV